jgi:hypothetical protein
MYEKNRKLLWLNAGIFCVQFICVLVLSIMYLPVTTGGWFYAECQHSLNVSVDIASSPLVLGDCWDKAMVKGIVALTVREFGSFLDETISPIFESKLLLHTNAGC